MQEGASGAEICTLGSGGSASGMVGRIEEKSRGGPGGGLGGRRAEKSKGPLVDVGTLGDWAEGNSLREHCCVFVYLVLS